MPYDVAVDATGSVYVADQDAQAIFKVAPGGAVSVLAGGHYGSDDGAGTSAAFNYPKSIAVDAQGNCYVGEYGNHAIRAAVGAMRDVFARIRRDGGIHEVDASLPAVKEIIALQGDAGMRELERRYLK